MAENWFTKLGSWEHFFDVLPPKKTAQNTESGLNILQSGPRKFTRNPIFRGLAPIPVSSALKRLKFSSLPLFFQDPPFSLRISLSCAELPFYEGRGGGPKTEDASPFKFCGGFFGQHLVGVWIGGVRNGHFPESEKYFLEAEISRKIPEIPQKGVDFAKFQAPKFENSEPEKMQFHTPRHSIPPLDSLLDSVLRGFDQDPLRDNSVLS